MNIQKYEIANYRQFYPEYTDKSLKSALKRAKRLHKFLDAITIDYFMRPANLGGLGYGRKERFSH